MFGVTLWFFDPETYTLRYANLEMGSPMFRALRDTSRPVSPRLWFTSILYQLEHLGVNVPSMEDDEDLEGMEHAALVFWNSEGEGVLFPLFRDEPDEAELAALGMALHQLAQLMTDWPTKWERIPVGEDDEDDDEEVEWLKP